MKVLPSLAVLLCLSVPGFGQTRDWTRPLLLITNPCTNTVTQSMIQLEGYSLEELRSFSCDLTNASGWFTNLSAHLLDRSLDTSSWEYTTNTFQVFDVDLATGLNTFTLRATDLAGNTTSRTFSVTLLADTIAPVPRLIWPQNGDRLCGTNFTVRGVVDDPSAVISVTLANANGGTNKFRTVIERNGKFWAENLPLADGTSWVTISAIDKWNNSCVTNIAISRSPLALTIDPIDANQLHEPTITVTGTIDSGGYTVSVNGVSATVDGTTWTARNVPVNEGGTASFSVTATPSGQSKVKVESNTD